MTDTLCFWWSVSVGDARLCGLSDMWDSALEPLCFHGAAHQQCTGASWCHPHGGHPQSGWRAFGKIAFTVLLCAENALKLSHTQDLFLDVGSHGNKTCIIFFIPGKVIEIKKEKKIFEKHLIIMLCSKVWNCTKFLSDYTLFID